MIRIHPASRDPQTLLDPENWRSSAWNGAPIRDCRGCIDCCDDDWHRGEPEWRRCYGEHLVEDVRHGVSVCRDEEALINYLAHTGADFTDTVLVELEGEYADEEGHDAELGEILIFPSRIVSVRPADDEFIEAVAARRDELDGERGDVEDDEEDEEEVLTAAEAAEEAGVSVSTVRRWCRTGLVYATKQAGRWLVDADSLRIYVAWRDRD